MTYHVLIGAVDCLELKHVSLLAESHSHRGKTQIPCTQDLSRGDRIPYCISPGELSVLPLRSDNFLPVSLLLPEQALSKSETLISLTLNNSSIKREVKMFSHTSCYADKVKEHV